MIPQPPPESDQLLDQSQISDVHPVTDTRKLWAIYFPLALSWVCMSIESPISLAVISRLPEPTIGAAGFQVLMAISIFIEAPVIDLLSTSTTLGIDRWRYAVLSRFTWIMIGIVTLCHAAVAFTPLFDVVTLRLIGLPPDVAEAVRIPLMIMTPWSGFIGWRRYLQGLMIRHGITKPVSYGTLMRMGVVAISGTFFVMSGSAATGLIAASIGLVLSVMLESVYIHWASRPVIARYYTYLSEEDDIKRGHRPRLDFKQILRFHWPLTVSTAITIGTMPIISFALSRTENPAISLAAYQFAHALLWLFRTATYALPEVVISQYSGDASRPILKRFSFWVGFGLSAAALLAALTRTDVWFMRDVLGAAPPVAEVAHLAFWVAAPSPLLTALMSYVRGILTAHHRTKVRLTAISFGMVALSGVLALGIWLGWNGPVTASIAIVAELIVELAVLTFAWRRFRAANGPQGDPRDI